MSDCCGKHCDNGKQDCHFDRPHHLVKASTSGVCGNHPVIQTSGIKEIDTGTSSIESAGLQHVILSVEGMDCTSCEQKLQRALDSLPELSNISVSLLLSQAEFDLSESLTLNEQNVGAIIYKRTGFQCRKVILDEAQLDLLVKDNTLNYIIGYPFGVDCVEVVKTGSIRVYYQPQIVGARALLANPFFNSAKLAPPPPPPEIVSNKSHLLKTASLAVISAVFTIPVLVLAYTRDHLEIVTATSGLISLVFATIVQFGIGSIFYQSAFKDLIYSSMVGMDMLVVLSTTTAYVCSVIVFTRNYINTKMHHESPDSEEMKEFFETSTMLVTIIMIGKTLSAFARHRALKSVSMESLQSSVANIFDPESKKQVDIDARLLEYDDIFTVLPDASIVTDGLVISGESEVDESMITGESLLVPKQPGMSVVAGSINHSGVLRVKVTHLTYENTIKVIGTMVDAAKSSKPRIQKLADIVAGWFVPLIFGITLVVFSSWVLNQKLVHHQSAAQACFTAMTYAISSLIISCPCAIGLAVPMVVAIAGGVGARNGLVLKSAQAIETARKITHVVFDKTGTLTHGKLSVVFERYSDEGHSSASLILAATSSSRHPVSVAVTNHLIKSDNEPLELEEVVSVPGEGIEGKIDGFTIRAGNPYWLGISNSPEVYSALSHGLTIFCVTIDSKLIATFGLQDELRPDAVATIRELERRSINVSILSGDNASAVNAIVSQLNIHPNSTLSRCTPASKQTYIQTLLSNSKNTVLFCGDGTNDAVALAQASIGVHMNEGTDVAQSAADVILMRPSLHHIITLIDLSYAFYRRVIFNFVWCFVYNFCAVLLAAGAFPGLRIQPRYAGLGEAVSVVPVIFVAMSLRWWRF